MVAGMIIAVFQIVRMLMSPLIGYHVSSFTVEMRNVSGVEFRTLDYENPGSNPVLRC